MKLEIGKAYKWKYEDKILYYFGKNNGWHQFMFNAELYCEVLDSDLWMMEQCDD